MGKMTAKSLAETLNGREYGSEISRAECDLAKQAGLIVLCGASDDLILMYGVVNDEIGMYNGGAFRLTAEGPLEEWGADEEKSKLDALEWFRRSRLPCVLIYAMWSEGGYSWVISADIPREPFVIMEDGEEFCRGIVLKVADFIKREVHDGIDAR